MERWASDPSSTYLIVQYSSKRAKKDYQNRQKGLKRLQSKLNSGRLTKSNINNRGYNKYLKMNGRINITIDYEKFETDAQWDGLKGYITNLDVKPKTVIQHYSELWHIERAFRISKTDLKIRPIYHRLQHRIEAHICIAFVAYSIYKLLETLLVKAKLPYSVNQVAQLAKTIYQIEVLMPSSKTTHRQLLAMDEHQQKIFELVKKI